MSSAPAERVDAADSDSDADGSSASRATSSATGLKMGPAMLTAALAGFAVMAAELTAVRLLAPHFGDSAYVWTNVIGVILAAMALGAVVGGRLSSRPTAAAWPLRLLVAGAALLALAPFLTAWLGDVLLPDELPLDSAMPALIRGSLVATALVFAPPLLLLAAIAPLLVVAAAAAAAAANSGSAIGRAAGNVSAAGTLGSLLGTFAATHWLVPTFGCRVALTIAAGLLLVAAAVLLLATRQRNAEGGSGRSSGAAILCLLLATSAWPVGEWLHSRPLRAAPEGAELLAERETSYQFLQVLRSEPASTGTAADPRSEPGRTTLVINEALDSFHSLSLDGSTLTGGAYYDWHGLAPWLATDGGSANASIESLRVLSIGDAAGTLREVYGGTFPGVVVDAVDIDSVTMALGDEFFADPSAKATGERFAMDGRLFLQHAKRRWQIVHVDAYAHQVYVPAHLASVEFFTAVHERLTDGGIVCCNVGSLAVEDEVLQAIGATLGSVFGRDNVRVLQIPWSRNSLLIGRRGQPMQPSSLANAQPPRTLSPADREAFAGMLAIAKEPSSWHAITATGPILRDDRPVLDELLFASYVAKRDPVLAIECRGSQPPAGAEQTAYELLQARDYQGVLAAVGAASQPTALLRQFAGVARFHMRHLRSARLEFAAGLETATSEDLARPLRGWLDSIDRDLRPIDAAEAAASRNGWLSLVLVGVFAALAFGASRL
ncbi:MAG: fused MFS/spermidine synthase [Planctomycetota bacterium]